MREVAGGAGDDFALTALANGYARAGGIGKKANFTVFLEPVYCVEGGYGGGGSIGDSIRSVFAPGMRVRVRASVPLSGLLGRVWKDGLPLESSAVVMSDPWKGCFGWLKDLLGIE